MANVGCEVRIYENNAPATGYQVGVVLPNPDPGSGLLYSDLRTSAGSPLVFDSGYENTWQHNSYFFSLWLQTPDRDPLSLNDDGLVGVFPFFVLPNLGPSNPIPSRLTVLDRITFWFVRVQIRVRWQDLSNPSRYPLADRWVGGGGEEWTGGYDVDPNLGILGPLLRDQSWYVPNQDPYSQTYPPDWQLYDLGYLGPGGSVPYPWSPHPPGYTPGYLPWGYTDADGLLSYRFLAAWAIGVHDPELYSGYSWTFLRPGLVPLAPDVDPSAIGEAQNIAFYVDCHGRHCRKWPTWASPPLAGYNQTLWGFRYPWLCLDDERYAYRQRKVFSDEDGGQHWRIDYSTWDNAGNFTTPTDLLIAGEGRDPAANLDSALPYHQSVKLRLWNTAGTQPLPGATVRFGPAMEYSSVTDAAGRVEVAGPPCGSPLATRLPWTRWGDVANFGNLPNLRAVTVARMPVADTAPFVDQPVARLKPSTGGAHLLSTYDYSKLIQSPTESAERGAVEVRPGDGGATLPLAGSALDPIRWGYSHTYLDGGEIVTRPWAGEIESGGQVMSLPLMVWEDMVNDLGDVIFHPTTALVGPADLDWCQDLLGHAYLAVAGTDGLRFLEGIDLEATFETVGTLASPDARITSPSRVIRATHQHLLAAVRHAAVILTTSEDGGTWTDPTVLYDAEPYAEVLLRLDPDGATLHLWMVRATGALDHALSVDGGTTWGHLVDGLVVPGPESVASLPLGNVDRGDTRHDGREWHRLHPTSAGVVRYTSPDGLTWTERETVSAGLTRPWLLHAPPFLVALGTLSGDLVSLTGSPAGTWDAPVTVSAGAPPGVAGFANAQKLLVTHRQDPEVLTHLRSRDLGTTWEVGSEG